MTCDMLQTHHADIQLQIFNNIINKNFNEISICKLNYF